jgi:hypothetical protein
VGIVRRSLVALALMFAVALSLFSVPRDACAQGSPIFWKTVQLPWSTGALTKDFTAAMTDTGFASLPPDVAWDVVANQFSGTANAMTLRFSTSTAAANADTVHYTIQKGAGVVGSAVVWPFTDYRNHTAAITNSALLGRVTGDAGLVFDGIISIASTTPTADVLGGAPGPWRIKVQGDPNGAEAALKIFLTYPSRRP